MTSDSSFVHRQRILIVDDDPSLRQALPGVLSMKLPYIDVHTCDSGEAAIKAIMGIGYHTVISDLRMPRMNGLELIEQTQRHGLTVPFLLMTGNGDYALALKAFEIGAQDFILKPFDRDELVRSTRLAIKVHHLRIEAEKRRQFIVALEGRIALYRQKLPFGRTESDYHPVLKDILIRTDGAVARMNASIRRMQKQLHTTMDRYVHLNHCLQATEEVIRRTARLRLERLLNPRPGVLGGGQGI